METNIVAVERLKEYSETEKEVDQPLACPLGLDLECGFTQNNPLSKSPVPAMGNLCLTKVVWYLSHIFMGDFYDGNVARFLFK